MKIIGRLLCALLGHKYVVTRRFNIGTRQVGCTRCNRLWAMHDDTWSFVEWNSNFEEMYREEGDK